MDVLEAIRTRRSIRKFKDKQVPWDYIVQILNAAKYAPFAGNILNSKFLVVKDEDRRIGLAEACTEQHWMALAPIHIVVVGEPEKAERFYGARGARLYTIQGGAAAIQNMLLAAHTLGLGGCWVGAFDEEEIRDICGLPEHLIVQAVVAIGFPDENPAPPPKYRIEHMMFFNKWWSRIEPPKTGLGDWAPSVEKLVKESSKIVKKKSKKAVEKVKDKLKKRRG